jgi:hypothetical protein
MQPLKYRVSSRAYFILLIIVLLAACAPAKQAQTSQTSIQPTAQPAPLATIDYGKDYQAIQLAWFYKPPSDGDLNSLAANYSAFILTRMDEKERDRLRTMGDEVPIYQYLLFGEIQDPGGCNKQPYHNQVAEKIGDFCEIEKQHPDWFLQNPFGGEVANDNGYKIMDPGNDGWRAYWLERARISQEQLGWKGVFLDNVEASLDKRLRYGAIPKKYPTDASYQAAIESNLQYIYLNYFKPQGLPLFANIISLNDPAVWFRYMQYLDGAMIENFALGWHEDHITGSDWETQMDLVEKTQALGKVLILVAQGSQDNTTLEIFALASYLLVNNGKAYFRYTDAAAYDGNWLYNNYHLDLGKPLGPRYKVGNTWMRDFEKGQVSVDLASNSANITTK